VHALYHIVIKGIPLVRVITSLTLVCYDNTVLLWLTTNTSSHNKLPWFLVKLKHCSS